MTRFGLWIFMSKITHDFWLCCAYKTSLIQPLLIYWRRVGVEKWFSCCLKTVCFVSITHFGSPNGALSERRIQVMWCTQRFMHNNYDWSETLYRDGTKWHWISYSIKTYIGFLYFGHYVICSFSIYGFWLPPFGIIKLFLSQLVMFRHC